MNKYIGDWANKEINETAKMIANAAIKYGMVSRDHNRKIVFDMDRWTRLDGDTGPYLQYVYVRIVSLCEKLQFDPKSIPEFNLLNNDQEVILMIKLSLFNDILIKAATELKTSVVCAYLFELGKLFNNFYASCPIKRAETQPLSLARLHLAHATGIVMKKRT